MQVSLSQFQGGRCSIPPGVDSGNLRAGTVRSLYFIDRSPGDPEVRLRDLVLLPCEPDEVARLHSVTLGIRNVPGATAAGTSLMQRFGLSLKFEQAFDGVGGDVGSKRCIVAFPQGRTPQDLDDFIEAAVAAGQPGADLVRLANAEARSAVRATYSSESVLYFGRYVTARRFVSERTDIEYVGRVVIRSDEQFVGGGVRVVRLAEAEQRRIETKLARTYGDEYQLDARYVQISVDQDFEALSLSFLDPEDILCWFSIDFQGGTGEVNAVVEWLGERGIDFRQYQLEVNGDADGYLLRLLCDLSQTDLHRFASGTLRELLFAELRRLLAPAPGDSERRVRSVEADFESDTLSLYGGFTEKDRFRLTAVAEFAADLTPVATWPADALDAELEREMLTVARTAGSRARSFPVAGMPQRSLLVGRRHGEDGVVVVVYDNAAPQNFVSLFEHYCLQKAPSDDAEIVEHLHRYLLPGLEFRMLAKEKFDHLGEAPAEQFRAENDARFSALGWQYIVEKWERDKFAFRGNKVLAEMLAHYLREQPEVRRRLTRPGAGGRVRLLDVGPGVGALSSILAIRQNRVLWENAANIDLVLVDSAEQVLALTRAADDLRRLPTGLLYDLQILRREELDIIVGLLRSATYVTCDISDRESVGRVADVLVPESFDLVYSGFCHHHMNLEMKREACRATMELVRPGGFVGIVDESFTYRQYLLYNIGHSSDEVEIAAESYFRSPEEHASLLEGLQLRDARRRGANKFYAFWGEARGVDAGAETAQAETRRPVRLRAAEVLVRLSTWLASEAALGIAFVADPAGRFAIGADDTEFAPPAPVVITLDLGADGLDAVVRTLNELRQPARPVMIVLQRAERVDPAGEAVVAVRTRAKTLSRQGPVLLVACSAVDDPVRIENAWATGSDEVSFVAELPRAGYFVVDADG